jgi:glucose-6-phosphate 1-dehydrogenase
LLIAIKDPSIKSTIPSVKLLKGLIKDQYERSSSSYTYSGYSNNTGVYVSSNVETYPNQTSYGSTAGGSALRTRTP